MRVDLEKFQEVMDYLANLNSVHLEDLEVYEFNQKIELPPKLVEEFRFTGLSNKEFINMKYWELTPRK